MTRLAKGADRAILPEVGGAADALGIAEFRKLLSRHIAAVARYAQKETA